ncbi:UPF0182 family protein [Actinomyces sp. oral taxon 181]|uniref:UPF0182 family membrane protein n=1 Tax=Actinomyces sp. oral taxon 181 TaxID=712121 RepID=UPI0002A2E35A|nr:UPF0182 family protein [Actinomyces sp. oral taxon 181]EKY14719.1 hypothetical protein HMPREF9061_01185 [Actinomyces sp. oral taxon 181 str. F0379]
MSDSPFFPDHQPIQLPKIEIRRPKLGPGAITLAVLVLLGLFVYAASSFWTEILWFQQMHATRILLTRWGVIAGLAVVGVVLSVAVLRIMIGLAHRHRVSSKRGEAAANLRQYQDAIEPFKKLAFWLVALVLGIPAGLRLAEGWQTVLTWLNATPFGKTDPIFGWDVSFFVFTLPFLELVVSFLLHLVILSLVVSIVASYLYGGLQVVPRPHATVPVRRHLGILAAVASVIIGVQYWIGRYSLLTQSGDNIDGAMYADVNATLPAHSILAAISIAVAALFLVAAFRGTWRLPTIGVVVTVVAALVIGGAYPALIEQFRVRPNARSLNAPYIQHNIDATLEAYGLDDLDYQTYDATTTAQPGQLREDSESTSQIRLLDPQVIRKTVQQLQQSRPYYSFDSGFFVDRYTINGERRDTVISMRELNLAGLSQEQQNWVNRHTVYTHGFGVVAAYGNSITSDGLPSYWEQSIPSKGEIGEYEPRVYFSQSAPDYSIVGGPEGTPAQELDYPDDNAPGGQVSTTFKGNGGPSVGNVWNKLLYSIKFGSTDIFFSSQTNEESQILYDRDPLLRVAKVAPYLTLEQKAYPAVVDTDGDPSTPKRLVWVVDAYTTTDSYPYAQHQSLSSSTVDSRSQSVGQYIQENSINYMRNSVKAIVDAYDGSVRLFQWDEKDPILSTWMKIYPGSVESKQNISADLMGHLRYPEDMFKVQRDLLTSYHVRDASDFYTGGDRWRLAEETSTAATANGASTATMSSSQQQAVRVQPPYYLTMQMPGQQSAEFSLTSVFVPGGESKREAMAGFLAVDSETGSEAGKVREGYGKLRLIALPSSTTVPGPGQIQNAYDTNQTIASQLNVLNLSDSTVIRGNLLTLPVGGGLLYVQPVYIQGSGGANYPVLRFVLTAFGNRVGFAPTLAESLDQTFGGDSAAKVAGGDQSADKNKGGGDQQNQAESEPSKQLASALQDANQAIQDGQNALKNNDWAAYGESQKRLNDALTKAIDAQKKLDAQGGSGS